MCFLLFLGAGAARATGASGAAGTTGALGASDAEIVGVAGVRRGGTVVGDDVVEFLWPYLQSRREQATSGLQNVKTTLGAN